MTKKKSAIKDYNIELRSYILNLALSVEDLSTLIVKSLLRKVKSNSKTLDNKSSSLSFKNKIDILYDLGDITNDAYNQFVKFMEIRNQFIHNPQCNKFVDLETISSDLTMSRPKIG
jgi:DNA-binding MltR family transcriptional regulator